VHRLTGELADWYDIDAGHLRIGDRADLVVVNPQRLDARLEEYTESPVPQYANLPRMVNRNDDAVDLVLIGGRRILMDAGFADNGGATTGRLLGHMAAAGFKPDCIASPLKNAGTNVGQVQDFTGRYFDDQPDIGAFACQGGTPRTTPTARAVSTQRTTPTARAAAEARP
jgi:hypothetical protein